ncbi:MAG: Ig-like domain-containing protein [Mariprofundales bacterium]
MLFEKLTKKARWVKALSTHRRIFRQQEVADAPLFSIMPLEDRIVLDGGLVGEALQLVADAPPVAATAVAHNVALVASDAPDVQGIKDAFIGTQTQVIVIDANASQADILAVLANASENGRAPITSLSLFSHGRNGTFQFGETTVTDSNVQQLSSLWQGVDSYLADGGNFLVYGCNLAASASGQAFVDALAQMVNADVYASNDTTGQGGDWVLEVNSQGSQTFSDAMTPVVDALLASVQGQLGIVAIDAIGSTNINQPFITGTGVGGDSVTITGTGPTAFTGTAFVDAQGVWSFNSANQLGATVLADGLYTLTAATGTNTSQVTFTVDTIAPAVIDATPAAATVSLPPISGTAEAGASIAVIITGNGTTQTMTVTAAANGVWSGIPNTALSTGTYTLDVSATDAATNTTNLLQRTLTINVPVNPPTVIATTPTNTPAASGKGIGGNTIIIDVLNTLSAVVQSKQVTVAAGGTWTTSFIGLADAAYTVSATQSDGLNTSAAVTAAMLVDTTAIAPVVNTFGVTVTDIAGNVVHISNTAIPTITGTGEAGGTITINEAAGAIANITTVIDALGNWTVPVGPVAIDGRYTLLVTQVDALGNSSAATPRIVAMQIDTAVTGLAISGGVAATSTLNFPTITGSGESALGAANTNSVSVTITDQVNAANTQTITSNVTNGQWSLIPTTGLVAGIYTVNVTEVDEAGNTATVTQALTVTPLIVPPTISLSRITATNPSTLGVSFINGTGIANAGSSVTVTLQDANPLRLPVVLAAVPVDINGNWSVANTALAAIIDGTYSLTATQTTTTGTVIGTSAATAAVTGIIDTVILPPVVNTVDAVVPVGGNITVANTLPVITATAEAGSSVAIALDGAAVGNVIANAGAFTYNPTLSNGTHIITFTATDAASNISAVTTLNVTVDTVAIAPTVNQIGTVFATVQYTNALPTISGTGEAGATVTISGLTDTAGTAIPLTALVNVLGAWTVTIPVGTPLFEGIQNVTVNQTDIAGNLSPPALAQTFVVDSTVTPSITSPAAQAVSFPTISGTAETARGLIANTVTVTLDNALGARVASLTANVVNGIWSTTPTTALANGAYTVTVTQIDELANVGTNVQNMTIGITIAPPVVNTPLTAKNPALAATALISGTGLDVVANGTVITVTATDGLGVITALGSPATLSMIGTTWSLANNDATLNALADGSYTINVTQQTTTGQTIGTSLAATATLVLDTVAISPAVQTVDAVAWNPLTPLTISNTSPVIAIQVEPNARVKVIIDGNTVAPITITADAAGLATFTPITPLTGPTPPATSVAHSFTFTQTDNAGNISIGTTISMSIDNLSLPPAISPIGILVGATQVTGANPTFSGTGEIGATVTITGVTDALGAAIPLTAIVDALGAWTATLPVVTTLVDGVYNLSITQTDLVGNLSAATAAAFTVDTAIVPLTIDTPANQSNNIFALSGTAELARGAVANVITLTITDNAALPGALPVIQQNLTITPSLVGATGGVWNVPQVTLVNGAYTVTINQTDETGNNLLVTQALTVLAVVQPPALAIGSGGQANPALALSPIITGAAMNGALVNVTITPQLGAPVALTQVTASITGAWVIPNTDVALAALLDGLYTVTATQTMNTGSLQGTSVASTAQNLTIDKIALAPAATISNALASPAILVTDAALVAHILVNTKTPLLSGTAEPNSFITITDPAAAIPPAVTPASDTRLNGRTLTTFADATGAWSLTLQALGADGLVNLNVVQQDVANNTSVASVVSFEIDSTVNNLAMNNVNSSTISFPVFTGTAEIALSGLTANTVTVDVLLGDGFGNPLLDPLTSLPTLVETITATVSAAGAWTVTPLNPLPVSELIINLNQTDEAGNVLVATQVFQSNPTVPPPVFTNLAAQSVINPITIAAAPAITGTALIGAAATVNVTLTEVQGIGAVALPNIINTVATVDALGAWQITGTQLIGQLDATYAVTATQTTTAGQVIGTSLVVSSGADIILDSVAIAPAISNVDGVLVVAGTTHNTANTTPAIALQVEPNATVNVTLDGLLQVPLTPFVADAQGLFTFTPAALAGSAAGTLHTVNITQTDLAGNTSLATTLTINVDNLAVAPVVNAVGTLFGATQVTNITTPILSGTAELGARVSVSGLGFTPLPAVVDALGAWTLQSPALAIGTYNITVTQTDALGNISVATNSSFVVDTVNNITVPIVQNVLNTSLPTINGTGEIARALVPNTVTVTIVDNAAAIGAPAVATIAGVIIDAAGNWTTTLANPLPNGSYTVSVTGTDEVGNPATVTQALTMGTIIPAPTLAITSPANPAPTGTLATIISGTNELGAAVNVNITDPLNPATPARVLAATVVGQVWTITNAALAALNLVDGRYSVAVSQDRMVNTVNVGTSPVTAGQFVIDSIALAPVVNPVGNNLGGTQISNATPTISGSAEPGSIINIANIAWAIPLTATADGLGNWTITLPALNALTTNGVQTLSVTQIDAVGNLSPITQAVFTVDTLYTPLTFTSPVTEITTSSPTITGTGELALGINSNTVTVSLIDNAALAGALPIQQLTNIAITADPLVPTNGIWTITLPTAIANGSYTVSVTGIDEVGNTAVFTQQLSVNVPIPTPGLTTPPTAVNPATVGLPAVITGTNVAGATVSVTVTDPANIAFVPVQLTAIVTGTQWTVNNQQLTAIADGFYQVSVRQTVTNPPAGVGLGTSAALTGGITLDRVALAPVITPFGNAITTGAGISYLVNSPTPTVIGTAEPGARVTLNSARFIAAVQVTADALGAWTAILPNLGADGIITITAAQVDAAGNSSAASPAIRTFTLDTAIQNLTILSAATTTLSLPDIIGTGESAIGQAPAVNNVTVTITSQTTGLLHETITAPIINGSWTATPTISLLADTYNISVTQTDEAGNVFTAPTQVLTANPTVEPPTIALHPAANTLNPATPPATAVIAGKGIAGGNISVSLTDIATGLVTNTFATVLVDAANDWSIPNAQLVGIADGSYAASATQTMTTGATLGTSQAVNSVLTLTIDTVAPLAPVIAVSSTQVPQGTTTATATFTGEVNATIAVIVDGVATGQKIVLLADPLNPAVGVLTINLPTNMATGAHSISGIQTDVAGNASAVGNMPYDITPAATNIISASNPAAANPAVTNIDPMIGALAGAPVTIVADPRVSGVSPTVVNLHPATNAQGAIIVDPFNSIVRVGPANMQSVVAQIDPVSGINPVTGGTLDAVISNNITPVIAGQLQDAAGNPVTLAQLGVTNPNILVGFTDAAGNAQSATTTMLANGSWSLDLAALPAGATAITLVDGNYKVSAQPIAGAGVFSFDLVIDTLAPITPSIIQFTEVNGLASISGTAEPNSRVVVQINPTSVVTADALGQWAITGLQLVQGQTYTLFLFSMDLATNTTTATPFTFTIAKVGGGIQINQPSPFAVGSGIPIMAGNVVIDSGVLQGITGEVVKGILDRIVGDVLQQGGTARHVIFGADGLRVVPDTGILPQIILRTINGFPLTSHPGSSYDTGAPLGEPYRLQPIDTHRLGNDVADKGGFVGKLAIKGDQDGLGNDTNASIEASKHANLRDALNSLHFATTSLGNNGRMYPGRLAMFAPERQGGDAIRMDAALNLLDDVAKVRLEGGFPIGEPQLGLVLFDFDRYNIKMSFAPLVRMVPRIWDKSTPIRIVGHTDYIGTDEYNQKLGMQRALAVKNTLVRLGISPKVIMVESMGEAQPIADNKTDAGRSQNRRAEINVSGAKLVI